MRDHQGRHDGEDRQDSTHAPPIPKLSGYRRDGFRWALAPGDQPHGDQRQGDAGPLDAGQPLYWSWAPNGNQLLVHAGDSVEQRLSFLTLQEQVIEEGLEVEPTLFQAPAWSPDGRRLLVSPSEGREADLMLVENFR